MRIYELDEQPLIVRILAAAVSLVLVVYIDFVTGPYISFSLFYLLPVGIIALGFNRTIGISSAVVAASIWFSIEMLTSETGADYYVHVWNAVVRMAFFLLVTVLLITLKEAIDALELIADTDGLTGLANHRKFYECLEREFHRAKRYNRPISLIYVDLDNFKAVNDQKGHDEGDIVLKVVAEALKKQTRQTDTVGRLGGDEFAALLPETPLEGARTVGYQTQQAIVPHMEEGDWPVTLSMGVVTFTKMPLNFDELIKCADKAMYDAKKGGKNTMVAIEVN